MSIAIANKKFDIKDIIKYLFKQILPLLSNARKMFDRTIKHAPMTFFNTNGSFKKRKPKIIRNTVDSCFSILNVDGARP